MLDNICGVCGDTFSDLNEDLMAAKLEAKKHGVEINTFESNMSWNELKLNSDGMIPVVVQDYKNLEVLMVAYMNRQAFEKTVESGKMTYWSRSRNELCRKVRPPDMSSMSNSFPSTATTIPSWQRCSRSMPHAYREPQLFLP